MKTPMQEHIEWLKEEIEAYALLLDVKKVEALTLAKEHAEELLEKEKEVMCEFAEEYVGSCLIDYPKIKIIFDQTFNTKEK